MLRSPASYAAASVLVFWAGVAVCAWLGPIDARRGLSAFAHPADTRATFVVALVSSAALLARHAWLATEPRRRRLAGIVALWMLAVVLVPTDARPIPGAMHTVVGSGLFVAQLVLGWHLARGPAASPVTGVALGVQCAAAGLTLLSLAHVVPYMLLSQVVAQAAFGGVLITGTRTVP